MGVLGILYVMFSNNCIPPSIGLDIVEQFICTENIYRIRHASNMRGIILAGGSGTRLLPMTSTHSKHLIPVYDKPMIYYPLSSLMAGGIKEILIISTSRDLPDFQELLGNGSDLGIKIQYEEQESPKGLPEAFIIGKEFIGDKSVVLILGDNIFHGMAFPERFNEAKIRTEKVGGANLFGSYVEDPERFGVAKIDASNNLIDIEEKPNHPKSNIAVTGLYMYDNSVCERSISLSPSSRGELEITDLNMTYVNEGCAELSIFGDDTIWLDAGTPDSLLKASEKIRMVQISTGRTVACLEEIAWKMGYIGDNQLRVISEKYGPNGFYGSHLGSLIN